MSHRNVWLKFDEWELIHNELKEQKWHSFQLSQKQIDVWKEDIKRYSWYENRKFERVGIFPEVEYVKSARALNILCRENWRPQDMRSAMKSKYDFIGFIITHCEDVNMDTTLKEWEEIRNEMNRIINESDKGIWWDHELVNLYQQVTLSKLAH